MKNKLLKKFICLAGTACLCSTLFGCNSALFDSSVGPDGKKIQVEQENTAKPKAQHRKTQRKAAPVAEQQTAPQIAPQVTSQQVATAYAAEAQAGVVKPYVPSPSDNVGTLLPTVNALKDKTVSNNPYAQVTVSDVVNGKVSLDAVNTAGIAGANASAVAPVAVAPNQPQALTTQQAPLPQPFEPQGNIQALAPIEQAQNSLSSAQNGVEVVGNSVQSDVISLVNSQKCNSELANSASQVAYKLALNQAERLANETGPIYIAPTVVSESLNDCIPDVSAAINSAFKSKGLQTVMGQGISVAQNTGSSTVIPPLIRACKKTGVPLLNVSVIRHIGPKTVVTIRNIRVKNGITLVQNTSQL